MRGNVHDNKERAGEEERQGKAGRQKEIHLNLDGYKHVGF